VLLNHRRALFVSAALLGAGGLVCLLVAVPGAFGWVNRVDEIARRLAVSAENPPATVVAHAFSLAGGVWVNWPLRVLAALLLAVQRRFLQLAAFALAVISSELLIGELKSAYQRARPPGSLIETSNYSFPSGHAIAGAVTAVGLVVVLLPPGRLRWRWEVYAVIFAFLMALSRVYLRAHWLSDAVAGGLIGAGLALGWPALLQALRGRPDPAEQGPAAIPERP
jgi:membrane-associated phospholipid phosphatase